MITDWHELPSWPMAMFSVDGLIRCSDTNGKTFLCATFAVDASTKKNLVHPPDIKVRNCLDWTDIDMPLDEFVSKSRAASPFVHETGLLRNIFLCSLSFSGKQTRRDFTGKTFIAQNYGKNGFMQAIFPMSYCPMAQITCCNTHPKGSVFIFVVDLP